MVGGNVAQLWRYPVKSLGGEQMEDARIGPRGVLGDRLWAVRDLERDVTASAKRLSTLLTATARYRDPVPATAGPGNVPHVEITFPDGTVSSSDAPGVHAKLSELVGRDVRLTALPPADDTSLHRMHRKQRADAVSLASVRANLGITDGEALPDASVVPIADMITLARYSTPPGTFVDLAPIHVLTVTSLAAIGAELGSDLDVRRFRPNVLLSWDVSDDELPESRWTGAHLVIGEVILGVTMPTLRCVMPSHAQPGIEVDRRVTRAVAARGQRCLGAYCAVDSGGEVRIGDRVTVRPQTRGAFADAPQRTKRFAFGLATAAANRLSR